MTEEIPVKPKVEDSTSNDDLRALEFTYRDKAEEELQDGNPEAFDAIMWCVDKLEGVIDE